MSGVFSSRELYEQFGGTSSVSKLMEMLDSAIRLGAVNASLDIVSDFRDFVTNMARDPYLRERHRHLAEALETVLIFSESQREYIQDEIDEVLSLSDGWRMI